MILPSVLTAVMLRMAFSLSERWIKKITVSGSGRASLRQGATPRT
jgi:hypothetical protein